MTHLTIREAARELGITPQALRSRVKHRGLTLEKAPGPHGERYLVRVVDLPLLRDETVSRDRLAEPSRETVARPSRASFTEPSRETVPQSQSIVPVAAHLEMIQLLRETQRSLQEAQEQRLKSEESMRLLERQTMAMQWELTSYRRALSENAESLCEQAARTLQVEQQMQIAELRADQALAEKEQLAEDNQRQREEFEREKAALVDNLRVTPTKAGWLKKNAPGWVQRLLGSG